MNMKKNAFFLLALFLIFQACKHNKTAKTTAPTEPILATIGNQPVYTSEFKYVYNKNNSNAPDAYSSASVRDYLRLYVNFRLKVREAEELGLDTAKSFKKELEGYKKQLSQPYFTEKSVTERLTKEAYDRMKEEINASHILIRVSLDADPKDTLVAYNKIMDIRSKLMKGEDFGTLAQQFSEDPSAKTNKGNLGYFTAFGTIYPFETAAYNTPVGSISSPVRTQFGYHLIKVNDRRKSQGQVKVAHIMIRASEGIPSSDSIAAKEKIDEIYKKLQAGEDWNKLVNQFSEDGNSKNKNGELMPFTAGKMIPSFEDAAFALQNPGDISKPVQTPYGWHIIKLLERKPLESFETLEPTIKQKVAKDRGEVNRKALIDRLKKENNFVENQKNIDGAISKADSSLLKGSWSYKGDDKNNPVLFTIGSNTYTQADFFGFVSQKQRTKKNLSPAHYMRNLYKDFTEESLLSNEEANLENKYPDYKLLVKEYRDGILLFQMMDDKVWSKAIEDTAGLKKFFNSNREKYKWDYRAHTKIFSLSNKEALEKVKAELQKDKFVVKDYHKKELTFAKGKDSLSDDDKRKLDVVSQEIHKNKNYVAQITVGEEYSEGADILSKRIGQIQEYLKKVGVDSTKLSFKKITGSKTSKNKAADRKTTVEMFTTSAKELEKYINTTAAPLTLQVTEGTFQKGENEILKAAEWKEGTQTFEKDGRIYYVVISKIDDPRLKNFDEARGLIISDYQTFLEQEWIEELKRKYPVVINEDEVNKIIKQ